jgi:alpha-beta hydrolase superfamily lysophospholipase
MKTLFSLAGVLLVCLGLALWLGGPRDIVALASINAPFAKVDFSAVPKTQTYIARDGAALAYLHYPALGSTMGSTVGSAAAARRIVLVHGSSARGQSMHPLAQALAAQGFVVDALDMRGHSSSGPRGHIAYIGQLEDDVADFIQAVPHAGSNTLLGHSSGGGFVLRFAASAQQALFDRYVLLAPYLRYDAPTAKPGNGGWVSVGIPRVVGLRLLNAIGITTLNHLPVTHFALDDAAKKFLTASYSHALGANFGPHNDYVQDIRNTKGPVQVLVGADDELFDAQRFASVFADAGKSVPVTIMPGVNHMGITLDTSAHQAVAAVCRQ